MVIAIVAVLASLLLPALSQAKQKAGKIRCLGNFRQLTLCWILYADDYEDRLPPNETVLGGGRTANYATARTWVTGNAFIDVGTTNIQRGVLFPYNRSTALYRCPADRSTVRDQGKTPRSRSVALSMWMNTELDPGGALYPICWHKLAEVREPGPSAAIAFVDEHEDSIENGRFATSLPGEGAWIDFPALRHDSAAALSFADGHAEVWRWRSPTTLRIGSRPPWINGVAVHPRDPDLMRLHEGVPQQRR